MALTDYCAFDEVRGALGVNDEELSDDVLALPIYEIGLVRELGKVSPSLPAAFSAVRALEEPLAQDDQALADAVRLFAAYAVAKQVGASLATFAPKDIGDGKATLSRFSGQPYADTMDRVQAALADARSALKDAYDTYVGDTPSSTVALGTFLKASPRATDTVTGS